MDPYERADQTSDVYYDWLVKNDYILNVVGLRAIEFLQTFKAYPPSQLPASFSVDGVEDQINQEIYKTLKPNAPITISPQQ